MIPEEFKQDVLTDGLAFIRTITNCYGAETGMELWSQIAEVLDPDVKGQMFFAMITGNHEGTITVRDVTASGRNNKVAMIKAIREVTGLGLKEAKDHADALWSNSEVTLAIKSEIKRSVARSTLQMAGAVI